jgi:hypothetical protein
MTEQNPAEDERDANGGQGGPRVIPPPLREEQHHERRDRAETNAA